MRKTPNALLLTLIGLMLALVACQDQIRTSDEDLKLIQTKELKELLASTKKKDRTVLVDVRRPDLYAKGHIPGAINIFLPQIVGSDPRLAPYRNIVVYANGWTDYLSPAAAKSLLALGYTNVFDYRGGIELWQNEGGRLEAAAPTTEPAR